MLSGNNDCVDNDNEIKVLIISSDFEFFQFLSLNQKMERFMIINESDIDSTTDWFKNGFNQHIYSVGLGEDNHQIELNFDEYDYEVNDKNDLNDLQKY